MFIGRRRTFIEFKINFGVFHFLLAHRVMSLMFEWTQSTKFNYVPLIKDFFHVIIFFHLNNDRIPERMRRMREGL